MNFYTTIDRNLLDHDSDRWSKWGWDLSHEWITDAVTVRVTVTLETEHDMGELVRGPTVVGFVSTMHPICVPCDLEAGDVEQLKRDALADVLARIEAEKEAAE